MTERDRTFGGGRSPERLSPVLIRSEDLAPALSRLDYAFREMEGGSTDRFGRRWYHEPLVGWRLDDRPSPFMRRPSC